jgi:hypothetical protein
MTQMQQRHDRNKGKRKPDYMKTYGYYKTAVEASIRAKELGLGVLKVKRSNNRWKTWAVCEFIKAPDPLDQGNKRSNKNKKRPLR